MAWRSFCCWAALLLCAVRRPSVFGGGLAGSESGAGSGTAVAPAEPGELSGAGILGQQEVRQMALETRI
jgi:hypothetical protein